eukprot:CAMPEP_0118650496 /NCGR_PEP_ID=MMETSP0785-20121206/10279_1 /TAXON_ID=91992 /ORGANISM="Bolidomonas pacifica, Strain CCMP 1866" /LENGTH=109 /DNA_ID=CAMNT_0006542877 /DNA_START=552 /DNA_END=883 /DNA_ORIENTATION=+
MAPLGGYADEGIRDTDVRVLVVDVLEAGTCLVVLGLDLTADGLESPLTSVATLVFSLIAFLMSDFDLEDRADRDDWDLRWRNSRRLRVARRTEELILGGEEGEKAGGGV